MSSPCLTFGNALSVVFVTAGLLAAAEPSPGAKIYQSQCASCHGEQGAGAEGVDVSPLRGTMSVAALATLIDETMPEDDPQACRGSDAEAVAGYMHKAFYYAPESEPVRRQLSRLTADQHRRVIVDTLSSFVGASPRHDEFGLRGEYFDGRRMSRDKRKLTRVDPWVAFEWGDRSPLPGEISQSAFTMRWQGSVLPPESGEYEFIVETDNGVRLWVNDRREALIDGWVQSGARTRHKARISLLAGRGYYLRLEFLSFKQDQASVHLRWRPPGGVEQPIPPRRLSTAVERTAPILETSFPPDDRSYGYERGIAVSAEWDRACTDAALEAAEWTVAHLDEVAGLSRKDSLDERREKSQAFCAQLLQRCARLPWAGPVEAVAERFFGDGKMSAAEIDAAVKRCVLFAFKSPRFLFRIEKPEEHRSLQAAHWLALCLWDSAPDSRLWAEALSDRLETEAQVRVEAERMLRDPRARAKLREMMHHYLTLDRAEELVKDGELFPEFKGLLMADLRASLDAFVDRVVWEEDGSFATLMTADAFPTTPRMGQYYLGEAPLAKVSGEDRLPPFESALEFEYPDGRTDARLAKLLPKPWPQRSGLVSHPYMLATLAYDDVSSPIHRGVFLTRHVLGQRLKPPPEAVTPIPAKEHGDLTTRQRVELQTGPAACQTCHRVINSLGFSLEHFDAVGRFREHENRLPIDARGRFVLPDGKTRKFAGAEELAKFIASNRLAHESFVEQLFEHTTKQPPAAFGATMLAELTDSFEESGLNVRELWVELVVRAAPVLSAGQSKSTSAGSEAN